MKQISKTNQQAFTLIELLVVIAVLGVLAAGVLTAINPLKRINQATDATTKNNVGQLVQALQSYYTLNQFYPTGATPVAALGSLTTNGDLKVLPSGTYTYQTTGTCSTGSSTCESSIYASLNDFTSPNSVWCWKSATQIVTSTTLTGCTP